MMDVYYRWASHALHRTSPWWQSRHCNNWLTRYTLSLAGHRMGRLWTNRGKEDIYGRSTNYAGWFRSIQHCNRMVQTIWDFHTGKSLKAYLLQLLIVCHLHASKVTTHLPLRRLLLPKLSMWSLNFWNSDNSSSLLNAHIKYMQTCGRRWAS